MYSHIRSVPAAGEKLPTPSRRPGDAESEKGQPAPLGTPTFDMEVDMRFAVSWPSATCTVSWVPQPRLAERGNCLLLPNGHNRGGVGNRFRRPKPKWALVTYPWVTNWHCPAYSTVAEVVGAALPTGAPLARQGRFASLRDGLRPPLTRKPLCALMAGRGAGQRPARRIRAAPTKVSTGPSPDPRKRQ